MEENWMMVGFSICEQSKEKKMSFSLLEMSALMEMD